MAKEDEGQSEVTLPFFKARIPTKQTAEIIAILSMLGLILTGFMLFEHRVEATGHAKSLEKKLDDNNQNLVVIMREMIELQKAALNEQREQTCLSRFDAKDRKENLDFCRRIGRQR